MKVGRPVVRWLVVGAAVALFTPSNGSSGLARQEMPAPPAGEVGPVLSTSDLPLRFEANRGQAAEEVEFLVRGGSSTLFLTLDSMVLARVDPADPAVSGAIRLRHAGASASRMSGVRRLPGTTNYLIGDDPARWRTGVPAFARVVYSDLYPGIDLIVRDDAGRVRYDYRIAPGASPGRIRVDVEGADGLELDGDGNLVIETALGPVSQTVPYAYQEIDGVRREVDVGYALDDAGFGFAVGEHDPTRPLVIDPIVGWATYLGLPGIVDDYVHATDGGGNTYVAGSTSSSSFPTTSGAVQEDKRGSVDAFVGKVTPDGTALEYLTYLGGSAGERNPDVDVDIFGQVVIGGQTFSANFPITAGLTGVRNPESNISDGYVSKLTSDGTAFLFSTYVGGTDQDRVRAVATAVGATYAGGATLSDDLVPIANCVQCANAGSEDAFVIHMDSAGATQFATYLGGSGQELLLDLDTDTGAEVVVTGKTGSVNFPTASPLQASLNGFTDAFVAKLGSAGTLLFSTYLGGPFQDQGVGLAVDGAGDFYVAAKSQSLTFPGVSGDGDGLSYAVKILADGSDFVWGVSAPVRLEDIAVDGFGSAWVVGVATDDSFSIDALQSSFGGGTTDASIARIDPSGAFDFATPWGGSGDESPNTIDVDGANDVYVSMGAINSNDMTTTNDGTLSGADPSFIDGFLLHLDVADPILGPLAICEDVTVTADDQCQACADVYGGTDPTVTLSQFPECPYSLGDTLVELTVSTFDGSASDTCEATVTVVDETPPVPECNAPDTIEMRDLPVTFTATATDNCSVASVEVVDPHCVRTFSNGVIELSLEPQCDFAVDGSSLTVNSFPGATPATSLPGFVEVRAEITWTARAEDGSGNTGVQSCQVIVEGSGG